MAPSCGRSPAHRLIFVLAALVPPVHTLRTQAEAEQPPGKVFYLFLADWEVYWQEIWLRHFADGQLGRDFEVFVHCQHQASCAALLHKDVFKIVDTEPSAYCENLIDPMLALYRAALPHVRGPEDKLVLLSHNSLPLHGFRETHRRLTEGRSGLASLSYADSCLGFGMKASQWTVLSPAHVELLLREAPAWPGWRGRDCWSGCADEYWPIQTLAADATLNATLRNKGVMWMRWDSHPVSWRRETRNAMARVKGPMGPSQIESFTKEGLEELVASESLFVRKVSKTTAFWPSMPLEQAWAKYIFRSSGK